MKSWIEYWDTDHAASHPYAVVDPSSTNSGMTNEEMIKLTLKLEVNQAQIHTLTNVVALNTEVESLHQIKLNQQKRTRCINCSTNREEES